MRDYFLNIIYDILLPHGQMSDVLPDGGEGAEDAEDVDWADGARPGDILQVTVTRLQWVLALSTLEDKQSQQHQVKDESNLKSH